MFVLQDALRFVVVEEGSDLHLKVGSRPLARIHGNLAAIEGWEVLQPDDAERVLREMLAEHPASTPSASADRSRSSPA